MLGELVRCSRMTNLESCSWMRYTQLVVHSQLQTKSERARNSRVRETVRDCLRVADWINASTHRSKTRAASDEVDVDVDV